jgi:hypothetical protein
VIRSQLVLSSSHVSESDMQTASTLITDLGVWDEGFDGPSGIVIPLSYRADELCPADLKSTLHQLHLKFPSIGQVCFRHDAELLEGFPTYEWAPVDP